MNITEQQAAAAIRYARNCCELNPDASLVARIREYFEDDDISVTDDQIFTMLENAGEF